jgi:hypothetical protein
VSASTNPKLKELFYFTDADLEANRAGYMTQDQAARFKASISDQTQRVVYFLFIMGLFGAVVICVWASAVGKDKSLQQFIILLGLLIIAGVFAIGYVWRRQHVAAILDSDDQQVEAVTGVITLKREYYVKKGLIRSMTVGDKNLWLTEAQYDYLMALSEQVGGMTQQSQPSRILDSYYTTPLTCTLYYANRSGTVMSMELAV